MVFKWRDELTSRFLDCYKVQECLWDTSNELYRNKTARDNAYSKICEDLNLPGLTVSDVRNKVKVVRTNYKAMLNKVLESEKNCNDSDEVFVPRLCWFEKADSFLRGVSSTKENTFNNWEMNTHSDDENSNLVKKERVEQISQPKVKKKKENEHIEPMTLECDCHKSSVCENEYDRIAKIWAIELQRMSSEQQIHAKKAINDILYEGQLGNLYRNCVQINLPGSRTSTPI